MENPSSRCGTLTPEGWCPNSVTWETTTGDGVVNCVCDVHVQTVRDCNASVIAKGHSELVFRLRKLNSAEMGE